MRFQVPQFIEIEDKIIGPLTLRQFLYLAGSAGLGYLFIALFPIAFLAYPLALAVVGGGIALAFYRPNNKPLINLVQAFCTYIVGEKLYIWKKVQKKIVAHVQEADAEIAPTLSVPRISDSKLKDLAWSLDVNEALAQNVQKGDAPPQVQKRGFDFKL